MAKEDKKVEAKQPQAKKQPTGDKYVVLQGYYVGSGENRKDYKKGDFVNYTKDVARQFIKTQTIKRWQK